MSVELGQKSHLVRCFVAIQLDVQFAEARQRGVHVGDPLPGVLAGPVRDVPHLRTQRDCQTPSWALMHVGVAMPAVPARPRPTAPHHAHRQPSLHNDGYTYAYLHEYVLYINMINV